MEEVPQFKDYFHYGTAERNLNVLFRSDLIKDYSKRTVACVISALNYYGMWRAGQEYDFSGANPWTNVHEGKTQEQHDVKERTMAQLEKLITEGVAVLFGTRTVRLLGLDTNSLERVQPAHFVMPLETFRKNVEKRWDLNLFAYVSFAAPHLLSEAQRAKMSKPISELAVSRTQAIADAKRGKGGSSSKKVTEERKDVPVAAEPQPSSSRAGPAAAASAADEGQATQRGRGRGHGRNQRTQWQGGWESSQWKRWRG